MGHHDAPAAFLLYPGDDFLYVVHGAPAQAPGFIGTCGFAAPLIAYAEKADAAGFVENDGAFGSLEIHFGADGLRAALFCLLESHLKAVRADIHDVVVGKVPDVCVDLLQDDGRAGVDRVHEAHFGRFDANGVFAGQRAFYVGDHMVGTPQNIEKRGIDQVLVFPLILHVVVKTDIAGEGECGRGFHKLAVLSAVVLRPGAIARISCGAESLSLDQLQGDIVRP